MTRPAEGTDERDAFPRERVSHKGSLSGNGVDPGMDAVALPDLLAVQRDVVDLWPRSAAVSQSPR